MTRRAILAMMAAQAGVLRAQRGGGMASRGVKPTPRGKPSGLPFNARFTDVAERAGLREPVIFGYVDHCDYILETMGSGVAFIDYDNDGWIDIFLASGTRMDGSTPNATNRLYKNNRDGTFTDVTEKAGLVRNGWAFGVTVGDYNNDGFEDIFVSYWGQNVLYRNNGDGTFTDVTKEAGLVKPTRWGSGCTWIDYDRDGKLDLFVANYLEFDPKKIPPAGRDANCNWKGIPVNCGPRGLPTESHLLFHNNGDGTFTDVSERSGIGKVRGSFGLTALSADFDDDGWPDIYVACDSTPSLLFRNNHDGTFTEEGLERGIALNEDGQEQAGMGLGIGDYNLDGKLDIFKTHFTEDTPILYRNEGKGNFSDVTIRSGLGVETRFICWGTGIQDLDNDGLPDVFVVTGSVYPEVEKKFPEYPHRTPRFLFRNLGEGKFEELMEQAGPALDARHASRGVAFGDFDNDGDLDILIMNQNEPPSLLRNDITGKNHWIKVKLVGTKSNRSAIGGRVLVKYGGKQQLQEVVGQSSFLSVSDRRLHFGLGAIDTVDVEIRWPNGVVETHAKVPADQLVTIKEGSGIVSSQKFPITA
ncbi:MAG TPA: CRTAC1 family protein [Bryobacteraceae bacterium]|nr:CRTAC1 family protein [Bryobacteraceae bacterium]